MNKYMTDAQGRQVPLEMVKDIDILRDQTVRGLFDQFTSKADELAIFRAGIAETLETYLSVSAEQYGVKLGGKKGGLTLTSFDGSLKIMIANNDTINFTEQLQVAQELIYKCIEKWTEGSRSEVKAIIDNAFRTDKKGLISASRILGLRALNIADPDWTTAMQAITDSIQIVSSNKYIRFYRRNNEGKYELLPLDVTAL